MCQRTGVTLVAVLGGLAAGSDLKGGLGHDLVEGVGAAGEDLAGVAVAEDVALLVGLEGPLPLVVAAVALGLEGRRHCCDYLWFGSSMFGLEEDGEENSARLEVMIALTYLNNIDPTIRWLWVRTTAGF